MPESDYDLTLRSKDNLIVYAPGRHYVYGTILITGIQFNSKYVIVTLVSEDARYFTFYQPSTPKNLQYKFIIVQISHVPVIFPNLTPTKIVYYTYDEKECYNDIIIENVWQIRIEGKKSVTLKYINKNTNKFYFLKFYSSVYYLPAYLESDNNFLIEIVDTSPIKDTLIDKLTNTNKFYPYTYRYISTNKPEYIGVRLHLSTNIEPTSTYAHSSIQYSEVTDPPSIQTSLDTIVSMGNVVLLSEEDYLGEQFIYDARGSKYDNIEQQIKSLRIPQGYQILINGDPEHNYTENTPSMSVFVNYMSIQKYTGTKTIDLLKNVHTKKKRQNVHYTMSILYLKNTMIPTKQC